MLPKSSPHLMIRERPRLIWAGAIVLVALALRLLLWSQPLHQAANDEHEYLAVAADLLAGRGWVFYESYHWLRAPLYPLFLAGSLWLAGGEIHLAALPTVVLSSANVLLIMLLTRALHPYATWAPVVAGATAALLLTLSTFASLYMSETLFTFLFLVAFVLLLHWRTHQHRWWALAGAAFAFGLAILTRSLPLAFLPVLLVWVALQPVVQPVSAIRRGLIASAMFLAVTLLPIAPWTARNCIAYGQCILVETGLSYNLWAFSEPHESPQTIFTTLESIPNPAHRADEATQRGLDRLREDPAILMRKLWPNWVYLWRVKPIQDRFLMASYYADPSPALFLAALLFDDLLMFVVVMLGIAGLLWAWPTEQTDPWWGWLASPRALCLAWLLTVIAITLLTHGEARYRHFVYPVLIPAAAILCTTVSRMAPSRLFLTALALLWPLFAYTILSTYPWEWATRGAHRSIYHLRGDLAAAQGNLNAAADAYQRAIDIDPTPDGFLALGDIRRRQGLLDEAGRAYRSARRREPLYLPPSARLGDLARAQGDFGAARHYFAGVHADEQQMLEWSWHHLSAPPPSRLDIGDGLDMGFVNGVYPAEQINGNVVRWSGATATLRLAPPPCDPASFRARIARPAPPDTPSVSASLCAGHQCAPLPLTPQWRVVSLLLSPTPMLTLHAEPFTAPDGRSLGMLLDWVEFVPLPCDSQTRHSSSSSGNPFP